MQMLKKGSKLNSILTGSCPKCHEESMYVEKNPYKMGSLIKMNDDCSHCKLHYQIEPSFFYGAMYVSYAVGIAFAVAAFVISFVFFDSDLLTAFYAIIATLIVFFPIIVRISRNIWINFFVSYDKNWKENIGKKS